MTPPIPVSAPEGSGDVVGWTLTLSLARTAHHDLVIRKDFEGSYQLEVWCGDGCRYLRIPFGGPSKHEWARWARPSDEAFVETLSAAASTARATPSASPVDAVRAYLKVTVPTGVTVGAIEPRAPGSAHGDRPLLRHAAAHAARAVPTRFRNAGPHGR